MDTQLSKSSISRTAYYATTGTFFGIAVVAAFSRGFIRIHYLRRFNADDYLFLFATATLITSTGLYYTFINTLYYLQLISEGRASPSLTFFESIDSLTVYAPIAELLSWVTIFSIKWSFLLYFRALVDKLYIAKVWWWITFAVFIPITVLSITGTFIVCPHIGTGVLANCGSGARFLRREHGFLYFSVASDIITDIMLICIPVIVLRTATFNLKRKLSIAIVLCLSIFMIAIGLVRGISTGVLGTEDQTWNLFWGQLEASVSVIAACPNAFRSLFLIHNTSRPTPERGEQNQGTPFFLERLWRRTQPKLPSIKIGATLTGLRIAFGRRGQTNIESKDEATLISSTTKSEAVQSTPGRMSLEESMRGERNSQPGSV